MLTTIALLAGLLSAPTNPPAASPPVSPRVQVGHGIQIALAPLGPARPADKREQQQVFSFYVSLFDR